MDHTEILNQETHLFYIPSSQRSAERRSFNDRKMGQAIMRVHIEVVQAYIQFWQFQYTQATMPMHHGRENDAHSTLTTIESIFDARSWRVAVQWPGKCDILPAWRCDPHWRTPEDAGKHSAPQHSHQPEYLRQTFCKSDVGARYILWTPWRAISPLLLLSLRIPKILSSSFFQIRLEINQ